MAEYQLNSNRSKVDEIKKTKVEKVVNSTTKIKKQSGAEKIAKAFVASDTKSVRDTVIADIIIPSVKQLLAESVKAAIDMLLFQEVRHDSRRPTSSRVSYDRYYSNGNRERAVTRSSIFEYDDIIFETRGDAESVLSAMDDIIDQFGFVSVADFYDLSDISTDNYSANKYGWKNIRSAEVVRMRDRTYIIKLPKARPLD